MTRLAELFEFELLLRHFHSALCRMKLVEVVPDDSILFVHQGRLDR